MGTLSFLTKLRKNIMSSERMSQELLEKLDDRFELVCKSLGEISTRRVYYIQAYGNAVDEVYRDLLKEKVKLNVQMEAIKRFLNE